MNKNLYYFLAGFLLGVISNVFTFYFYPSYIIKYLFVFIVFESIALVYFWNRDKYVVSLLVGVFMSVFIVGGSILLYLFSSFFEIQDNLLQHP